MNSASKLDAQLYPVLASQSHDAGELKTYTSDKLAKVLIEIRKAQEEIQQRIDTTAAIKPKDDETREKVSQVIYNLNEIKIKLENISENYKSLLTAILSYLNNIATMKSEIERYFQEKSSISEENVDNVVRKHAQFKENTMAKFRALIQQSELVIGQVRDQEPGEAKEHDTDRILSLLEQLRILFESQNESKSTELKKQHEISKFTKDLQEIHTSLDDLTRQLNETQSQNGESSVSAKSISLAFEYFERTTQVIVLF